MIAIILNGGLVQAVVSDETKYLGAPVLIIDYDTDGNDPAKTLAITQHDGSVEEAYVHEEEIALPEIDIADLQRRIEK